jgi:hypothetical protein
MKATEVGDGEQTTHVLVFDKGEEVMAGLLEVVLVDAPAHLQRQLDEETGLPLIRL